MAKMTATEAKNRFGQLLEMAQAEPVHVQKDGRDVGVMISPEQYRRFLERASDLVSRYGTADMGPWGSLSELGGKPHEIPEVYHRSSPISYAHLCTTPTLLVQGEHDWRCPAGQAEQFYAHLKANGCITEMVRYPEQSHLGSITGPVYVQKSQNDELLGWISRTRATQHKLLYVIGIMLVVSSVLLFWKLGPGLLALGITAIVAISGFWITSSHILEWNDQLAALRRTGGM